MVVCCRKAPFARFDRSAYTSESGGGRRISETVNPAGFPWITTRELSVCATNCAASSATGPVGGVRDRKSTRLNSSHGYISYAVFCLKKKKKSNDTPSSVAA